MDIRLVRAKENSSVVAITVQDVGVGMSESQLDVSRTILKASIMLT